MRAIWNDQVIAESDATIVVEGNYYFPRESILSTFYRDSDKTSTCFWKGLARYKHIEVNGEINQDAAWYYPDPKPKAENIKGYFAFWKGVVVKE